MLRCRRGRRFPIYRLIWDTFSILVIWGGPAEQAATSLAAAKSEAIGRGVAGQCTMHCAQRPDLLLLYGYGVDGDNDDDYDYA